MAPALGSDGEDQSSPLAPIFIMLFIFNHGIFYKTLNLSVSGESLTFGTHLEDLWLATSLHTTVLLTFVLLEFSIGNHISLA